MNFLNGYVGQCLDMVVLENYFINLLLVYFERM